MSITPEQINKLASFMQWHQVWLYEPALEENVCFWTDESRATLVQADYWNPDIDMSDAWMLIDQVRLLSPQEQVAFEGFLSSVVHQHDGRDFSMRASILDITPEAICLAILKLVK